VPLPDTWLRKFERHVIRTRSEFYPRHCTFVHVMLFHCLSLFEVCLWMKRTAWLHVRKACTMTMSTALWWLSGILRRMNLTDNAWEGIEKSVGAEWSGFRFFPLRSSKGNMLKHSVTWKRQKLILLSLYRLGQTLRVPEGWGVQNF